MDIEDIMKNINPKMLSEALSKANGVLSNEQIKQVENTFKSSDKQELKTKLHNLTASDLKNELNKNPELLKQLTSNPELMKKINDIFKK